MARNELCSGGSERPWHLRKQQLSTSMQTCTHLRPWLASDQERKCSDPQPQEKKKAEGDFGVVSWDRLVYSSLLEDNYSLIQFMIQNAPNPLTNASFPPPSTFQTEEWDLRADHTWGLLSVLVLKAEVSPGMGGQENSHLARILGVS